jgi:hypothetical protein
MPTWAARPAFQSDIGRRRTGSTTLRAPVGCARYSWMSSSNAGQRGQKKYTYTVDTIVGLTGRSVASLRTRPDLDNLGAVVTLVQKSQVKSSRLVDPAEWCPDDQLAKWAGRWPLLDFYTCGTTGCAGLILGQTGMCFEHGGGRHAWKMSCGYFHTLMGKVYRPFHRMVVETPDHNGMDVHHLDSNRLCNLEVMTARDHALLHGNVTPRRTMTGMAR